MSKPNRRRTARNRPVEFHESISPAMLNQSAGSILRLGPLPPGTMRYMLWGIWMVAAIAAGVGIGALIVASRPAGSAGGEAPMPVATAGLTISAIPALAPIVVAEPDKSVLGRVIAGTAVSQAQAGNPFQVASGTYFQNVTDTLQPGFTRYGLPQGAKGTDAVSGH